VADGPRPGTWSATEDKKETGPIPVSEESASNGADTAKRSTNRPATKSAARPPAKKAAAATAATSTRTSAEAGVTPSSAAASVAGPAPVPKAPSPQPPVTAAATVGGITVVPPDPLVDFPIRGLRDEDSSAPTESLAQWSPGRVAPSVRDRLTASAPGIRRARVYLSRVDPWTVMKTSFMLSLALGIVLIISTAILWVVLDYTGVFSAISQTVNQVAGSATTTFNLMNVISFPKVVGAAVVLSAIEIVLLSALATLFAFLYNLTVGISGGLEITLSEDD